MSNGTVTIAIEDYNALLEKVYAAQSLIRLRKGWSNSIEVDIDKMALHAAAARVFNNSPYTEKYELIPLEDMYMSDIKLATLKPVVEEEVTAE